ncbi:MAG: prepilin-type N-terminal cleavage/methylation domain-containing protein [bacterium]|nr:prepilin-type N-terminal cleavage/methylation domain-containing protein [bacterium]
MLFLKKNSDTKQQGFTLIELLVVISIIGILSALLLPNLTSAQARARDARRKSDLKAIATGLELYYNDNNYYPAPWTSGATATKFDFANALTDLTGNTIYIKSPMAKDPKNTVAGNYEYYYCTQSTTAVNNKKFNLFAKLENANDPDKCTGSPCTGALNFANVCSRGSNTTAASATIINGMNFTVSEP